MTLYVLLLPIFLSWSFEVQSECLQASVGQLPEGCEIGNLDIVSSTNSRQIIDDTSCENKINSTLLVRPPDTILLQNDDPEILNLNKTYLLTMVDRTAEKLIWMVTNMTVNIEKMRFVDSKIILPLSISNPYIKWMTTGYFFNKPTFRNEKKIEFLIFEERRYNASSSYININALDSSPFDLSAWINSQSNSGIKICGPVAGKSVIVVQYEQENIPPANRLRFSSDYPISQVLPLDMIKSDGSNRDINPKILSNRSRETHFENEPVANFLTKLQSPVWELRLILAIIMLIATLLSISLILLFPTSSAFAQSFILKCFFEYFSSFSDGLTLKIIFTANRVCNFINANAAGKNARLVIGNCIEFI